MNWLGRIIFVKDGPEPLASRIKRQALRDMGYEYDVLNWRREKVPPLPGQVGTAYAVRLQKTEGPLRRVRIIDREPLPRVRIVRRVRIRS